MAETLYCNPEYYQYEPQWTLARDLYEGDHDILTRSNYLWTHAIEEANQDPVAQRLRARRCQRTRYLNLSEVLISLWCSLFFKKDPQVDSITEALLKDHNGLRNIDGRGSSLTGFFRNKVLPSYLNYGKVVLVVDSLPIVARNITEERQIGARPFLDLIEPLNFVDWSREVADPKRLMEFTFARYQYTGVLPRRTSSEEPKLRRYSYEYRHDSGIVTLNVAYVDLDGSYKVIDKHWDAEKKTEAWQTDTNPIPLVGLDEIPIAVFEDESWLKDANQETLRHFNLRSNRDNINYNQGFQEKYLNIQGGKMDSTRIGAFNEYAHKILDVGESAFVLEPIDPLALEKSEQEAIRNVFRVGLNRLHSLPDSSDESPSADSMDKQNEYTSKLVESALVEIEDIANQALKHYAAFMGKANFEGKIELDKEVSDESFEQFITTWQTFSDMLSGSSKIKTEVARKALHKLRLPKNKMQELERELESAIVQTQKPGTQEPDRIASLLNGGRSGTEAISAAT